METHAYDLGKQAFETGIRIPFYDQQFRGLLENHKEKIPLLAAWYRGWVVASIGEPDR